MAVSHLLALGVSPRSCKLLSAAMECMRNNSLLAVRWISVTLIFVPLGNLIAIVPLTVDSSWIWTYGISTGFPGVFLSTSSFLIARVALVSDMTKLFSSSIESISLRTRRGMMMSRASRISLDVVVVVIYLGVWISLVDVRSERRTRLSIDNDLGSYLRLLNTVVKNYDLYFI